MKFQKSNHKILIVSLCLVSLLVGCSSIPAMFPVPPITPTVHAPQVRNGLIAFTAQQADNSTDIYTMNPDGSDLKRLTDKLGNDSFPIWTPDGKQILYISDETNACLDIMNFDGSNKRCIPFEFEGQSLEVTTRLDSFVWSPDGTKIAFDDSAFGGATVFVMNADGTDIHRVSPLSLAAAWPSWSPDSKQIAFVDGAPYTDIHVVDADGSNYRSLNDDVYSLAKPYWSRDGKHIFFQATSGRPGYGPYYIYVMDTDGTNIRRIVKQETQEETLWGISPDGSRLLLEVKILQNERTETFLMVVDANDFSASQPLVLEFSGDAVVSWSPDEKQILYIKAAYRIMNVDGTEDREIILPFDVWGASWQPIWK